MPEGDTIHKVASRMRPLLVGQTLLAARARHGHVLPDLAGKVVRSVDARGKHLLIALEGGPTIRVHLGLHGSWHRYAPGSPWQRRPGGATLVLETARDLLVAFQARRVELIRGRSRALDALGPDLLDPAVTPAQIVARARAVGDVDLAALLLDQRVAAGVGNVYKSETLFLEGLHPTARVPGLDDARLEALYARAQRLLRKNVDSAFRVTVEPTTARLPRGGARLHVYGRAGEPCLVCGATILRALQAGRSTYWCPVCQPR